MAGVSSFFNGLKTLLANNNKSWLGQILAGAGLGLASTAIFTGFVDYYKSQALANFGQLGAVSGLLGLSGIDKAISIIVGAYLASIYIKTFAVGLKVVQKK